MRRPQVPVLALFLVCWSLAAAFAEDREPSAQLECETIEIGGVPYDVVRIDPARTRIGLYWKNENGERFQNFSRLKAHLEASGKRLLFAMNSGIYAEDYTPLGLHIENGNTLRRLNRGKAGGGNFSLKPNGVFFIEQGKARILETGEYDKAEVQPELAVQSGPLLVQRGKIHPRFRKESESLYIRNGVGIDSEGRVVFLVVRKPVNFHTFASAFRDQLGCENALYLDGALSGLYAPCLGREDIGLNYVGILAVVEEANPEELN